MVGGSTPRPPVYFGFWPRLCEKSHRCYDSARESAQREGWMSGLVEGIDRSQSSLFPAALEDYVAEDNLVRAVDAFDDGLDLSPWRCGARGTGCAVQGQNCETER